jgi:hypothetical protein
MIYTSGDQEAFDIVRKIHDSMNFPTIPLEESLSFSEAKQILGNAMSWLLGGTACPNYPSSISEL